MGNDDVEIRGHEFTTEFGEHSGFDDTGGLLDIPFPCGHCDKLLDKTKDNKWDGIIGWELETEAMYLMPFCSPECRDAWKAEHG